MFEKEIEIITKALRSNLVPPARAAVQVKDILASDAPQPIKSFFRADVETLLYNEQQAYQKTSHFRHDHPEVRSLQSQINSILILQYEYRSAEFTERLTDAVHMIVNFLLRPQWTMANVIFEKDDAISTNTLITTFHYFGAYDYLKDIIIRYLRDKNPASVSRKEFVSLLWKADSEYILRKTGDELARIMTPLFDFFDYPANTGTNTLPVAAILRFLDDKGLMPVVSHLEGEMAQGKSVMSRRELADVLESVRRTSGPFHAEKTDHPHPPSPVIPVAAPVPATQETPCAPSLPPAAPPPVTPPPAQTSALEKLIGEHDRRRFIKKLFKLDETAFNTTLASLGSATSWKQASRLLDETFIQHEIDPYSSEAERFVDIIFEHFHPKQ